MKFRIGLALSACAGILVLGGCSSGGGTSDDNQGGDGGGGGGGDAGGNAGGDAGSSSPRGGKGGTATSQGGGGGAGGLAPQGGSGGTMIVGTEPDPSSWGACQMLPIPAGVMIGMTPLKTSPTVASKCIPAGSGISRALSLMATSTPQKKHKVKVLFYGQSITRGGWTSMTEAYLKQTFPNADLEIRQEAIGAFGAKELFRPMEADVITWYPDLVIYHNYGGYPDIDLLIQEIRRRTTAEVMHQTQHVTTQSADTQASYDRESYIYFPDIAKRLGIHTVDIRTPWKAYMKDKNKSAQDLTMPNDGLHLNAEGNMLYAQITNNNLKYDDKVLVDPLRMVNTFEIGKSVSWVGKKLTFDFDGNRLDFLAKTGGTIPAGGATVLIDGKKPSEFASAYGNTRANRELDNNWPWSIGSVMRVTIDPTSSPKAEDWTLKITSIDKAGNCAFTVTGSVTGADGNGTCASNFVSNSKRVLIAKEDFFFLRPQTEVDKITISPGYEVKWKTLALHADSYPPTAINAADTTKEYPTTIIQGIPNGKHKLELTATSDQPPPIEAIRVHRPPLH